MKKLFYFLILIVIVHAQEAEQIDGLKEAIVQRQQLLEERQNQIADIEKELGNSYKSLQKKIADRDRISQELKELKDKKNKIVSEIKQLNASIENRRQEILVLVSRLEKRKLEAASLLKYLYRTRGGQFSQVFAKTKTLHDLRIRNYYLRLLSERHKAIIEDLKMQTLELARAQELQTQQLNEMKQKENELLEAKTLLEQKKLNLENLIAELKGSREGQLALKADLLKEQQNIENAIARAQASIEELKKQLEEKKRAAARASNEKTRQENQRAIVKLESEIAARQKDLPALNSSYVYPVENPSLINKFDKGGFSGLALAADFAAAPVFAVQSGVVQDIVNMGANDGYMITILHADGITSAYLNLQQKVQVKIGETVMQKQIVGFLGGGSLTKPNVLKFYTYNSNGVPVNPGKILGF